MIGLLCIWLALLVTLAGAVRRTHDGGVLTFAYVLGLSLIHVPGALAFLSPESDPFDREATEVGFQITLIGIVAFVVGAIFVRMTDKRCLTSRVQTPRVLADRMARFSWRMLAIGSFGYFVLVPISVLVPSLTAIIYPLSTTLVIGIWLRLYAAAATGDWRSTLATLAMLPLLPLFTLATGGFIGFGVNWVLSVVGFLFVISSRRVWFYLAAPPAVMLGLSLFVAYMGEREGIRDVVWQQQASYSDRLERIEGIITNFQLVDLSDPMHRAALQARLNLNREVGVGVMRYQSGLVDLAYGSTFAWWSLIPRAIWPNKPDIGGGGSVVTDFTGISFAEGTSVGAGQVLEFYFNFGLPGVIVGFAGLGMLLMRLDRGIMLAFAAGDLRGILLLAMPGLILVQPGGNLTEIIVGAVGGLITARLIPLFAGPLGIAQLLGPAPLLVRSGARHRQP